MATSKPDIEDLLRTDLRSVLQTQVSRWLGGLTLPQAQRLREHAASLSPPLRPLKLAVVHTYTSDLLDPWLSFHGAIEGFEVQTYHAPYGLAMGEAAPDSALVAHQPDITLLMLRREDLHPDLARPVVGLGADRLDRLRAECLARAKEILGAFRAQPVGQLVLSLLPSMRPSSLGLYDAMSEASESGFWTRWQGEIAAWMRSDCPASSLLDMGDVVRRVGQTATFDSRYWYSSRFPFAAAGASEFARRVVSLGVVLKTPRAKVLVLDADNTLWGGVVGEEGFDGIALGPDYPGNAFMDFQRRILDFQQRGLILALCSKNNEAEVDQVLRDHPHQILRSSHFAARRVNWLPKAENLASLAEELNLGLDSFIFVDDSDHECAAVRHALPHVQVVQVPSRAVDVPFCLDAVARLEVLSLTAEDLAKTELYAQESRRRELSADIGRGGGNAADYLQRLQMKMSVRIDAPGHRVRLSQLTRKTNQFNLTTRRYDEHQVGGFIGSDDWLVADFSLADVFGDSGVVGLAMFRLTSPVEAELDTFLMSCRVIGRQAEAAFLQALLRELAARGVSRVRAEFIPTAKNMLAKDFLTEQGFTPADDGRLQRDLSSDPPHDAGAYPIVVDLLSHETA